ncbi:MAG: phosphoglycerate kinase, partial [Candidatus Micrarchaeota archaeon]
KMLGNINTLDDVELKGKTVLLRIDINSSIGEDGKVQFSPRFSACAVTIKELVEKGAKVVLLAHQGRPGDKEFCSLKEHAKLLSQAVGVEIRFVRDVIGPVAIDRIQEMADGEVILLENVRFLSEETVEQTKLQASKSIFVKNLSAIADFFVQDAFSNCHRSHASMVGFPVLLPSVAGRLVEKELLAIEKIEKAQSQAVFVIGGVKLKEVMHLVEHVCRNGKAAKLLLTGMPGLLFLKAKGINLGEKTQEEFTALGGEEFLPLAKELWKNYSEIIATPVDVAVDVDGKRKEYGVLDLPVNNAIRDIGKKTINNYVEIIKSSSAVFIKGVPGEFEKQEFSLSTQEICKALTECKGFTVVGGGSLATAFTHFNLDINKISCVSLSGGALLEELSWKKFPGIEALRQN